MRPDTPEDADFHGAAASERVGPLVDLRVVEFAGIGPGPFAAMLLADLGAHVVRIDRPGGSDPYTRHAIRRGRRTFEADLKSADDLAAVRDLLDGADALIEGFRPGTMERLGLGPDEVLARNPRLVYGRVTGWGQTGPLARAAGHDINYIALTGALAAIGTKEKPLPPLNLLGDFAGGSLYLIMGLLAGVLHARRSGCGQVIDCAICDGVASLMAMTTDFLAQGRWGEARESNLLDGGAPFYRVFRCADAGYISVGALEPKFYDLLCDLVGMPVTDRQREEAAWPELHERFEALFATRTRGEWTRLLEGTDACFAPVLTLSEAREHPHMAARAAYVSIDGILQPSPAPRFSGTETRPRSADISVRHISEADDVWDAASSPASER